MSEEKQKLISDAVEKALAGDADAVNNIEDRVTRAKAKAALVKAKREQPEKEDSNDDVSKSDEKELPVVDNTVQNGRTYYYAIVAYDFGAPNIGPGISPSENNTVIELDEYENIRSIGKNIAIVTPQQSAAG